MLTYDFSLTCMFDLEYMLTFYNNITVGSSFNSLINSGIVYPTAVLICPFIASVLSTGFDYFQWKSPFDTCPATAAPLYLSNLQVSVCGQNVLQSTLKMNKNFFEHFLEQVNLAEQITGSNFEVSTGLIFQRYWEASK